MLNILGPVCFRQRLPEDNIINSLQCKCSNERNQFLAPHFQNHGGKIQQIQLEYQTREEAEFDTQGKLSSAHGSKAGVEEAIPITGVSNGIAEVQI